MSEAEIYYEMLWDCPQCETRALLGESQRHCPTCGAAQDPTKRYFPPAGEEVQAKDHRYCGVDWNCAYCSSPNARAAAHCTNCGAGQDGSKPVALVQDTPAPDPEPAPPPLAAPQGRRWGRWVLAGLLLLAVGWMALFSSTKEASVTVAERSWLREVEVQQLASVSDSAWCEDVPGDAYALSRTRAQRSTRLVPDGQECHVVRQDLGDGTFVKRQECRARTREEPVYADRCSFKVNRWQAGRAVRADQSLGLAPHWPSVGALRAGTAPTSLGVAASTGAALGAEREGARRERYTLELTAGGKRWSCVVPESVWQRYEQGAQVPLKVRLTGGADCASLR